MEITAVFAKVLRDVALGCDVTYDNFLYDDADVVKLLHRARAFVRKECSPDRVDRMRIRTNIVDSFLRSACRECSSAQPRQVVILGCGLDDRAERLGLFSQCHVFELDVPAVIRLKERLSVMRTGTSRSRLVPHRITESRGWVDALCSAGYSTAPCTFILEGLVMYMNRSEVESMLRFIYEIAARGSDVLFHTVSTASAAESSEYCFGTDDGKGLLERAGFCKCRRVAYPAQQGAMSYFVCGSKQ